jgi:hypothetical protein
LSQSGVVLEVVDLHCATEVSERQSSRTAVSAVGGSDWTVGLLFTKREMRTKSLTVECVYLASLCGIVVCSIRRNAAKQRLF